MAIKINKGSMSLEVGDTVVTAAVPAPAVVQPRFCTCAVQPWYPIPCVQMSCGKAHEVASSGQAWRQRCKI